MESIQQWLFGQLQRQKFNKPLAEQVSGLLGISKPNAYKRIRGQARLTAQELVVLASHYNIPLQDYPGLRGAENTISVRRPRYIKNTENLQEYLVSTLQQLKQLREKGFKLYYAARDLPLFYYFYTDGLTRLKQLIWLRTANFDEHKNLKPLDIPIEVLRSSRQLFELYCALPTIELWTSRTADNLIAQLSSLARLQILSPQEHLTYLTEAVSLLNWRFNNLGPDSPQRVYKLDFLTMSNNALFTQNSNYVSFISFAGVNYLQSTNGALGQDMYEWFQEQISAAICLNEVKAEKEAFFKQLQQSFEQEIFRLKAQF